MMEKQSLRPLFYSVETIRFDVARNDEEYLIEGDFIAVQDITGECEIKIGERFGKAIDLTTVSTIKTVPSKFKRIYVTNKVQEGKYATLAFGGDASFVISPSSQFKGKFYATDPDELTISSFDAFRIDSKRRIIVATGSHENEQTIFSASIETGSILVLTGVDTSNGCSDYVAIASSQDISVYLQVSPDQDSWYDPKTVADGDVSWSCGAGESISISSPTKMRYLRVVIYNASGETANITAVINSIA